MATKQARNCRIGDINLYKNEASRIITDIDRRGEAFILCTTDLSGENFRCDLYEVNVRGAQEVLI